MHLTNKCKSLVISPIKIQNLLHSTEHPNNGYGYIVSFGFKKQFVKYFLTGIS